MDTRQVGTIFAIMTAVLTVLWGFFREHRLAAKAAKTGHAYVDERTKEILHEASTATLSIVSITTVLLFLWSVALRDPVEAWRSPISVVLGVLVIAWPTTRVFYAWRHGGGDIHGDRPWLYGLMTVMSVILLILLPFVGPIPLLVGGTIIIAILVMLGSYI